MAKITGQFISLYYAGYNLTGRGRQIDANLEYDEEDFLAFQDGSHNSFPGLATGAATMVALLDGTVDQSYAALKAPATRAGQALLALFGQGAAPVIGDPAYLLEANQFAFKVPLAPSKAILVTADVKAQGKAPGWGVVQAHTTIINTTAFAAVDGLAASTLGGQAVLEIFTPTAADTYTFEIQDSADGSTGWATIGTLTLAATARGSQRIAITGTIRQFTRLLATRTGGVGQDLGLACGLARNNS